MTLLLGVHFTLLPLQQTQLFCSLRDITQTVGKPKQLARVCMGQELHIIHPSLPAAGSQGGKTMGS